jgi:alanyl-tRNA synthetase
VIKSARISDGVVRMQYVAGERAISQLNEEDKVLNSLMEAWSVPINEVVPTAERFFAGCKKAESKVQKLEGKVLDLMLKCLINDTKSSLVYVLSDHPNPTLYFSHLPQHANALKAAGKGVIFIGNNFLFALLGRPDQLDTEHIREFIKGKDGRSAQVKTKLKTCSEVVALGEVDIGRLQDYLNKQGVAEFH